MSHETRHHVGHQLEIEFVQVGFILAVTKFAYPSLPVSGVSPIPFRSTDVLLQGASALLLLTHTAMPGLLFSCHLANPGTVSGSEPYVTRLRGVSAEPVTTAEGDLFLSPQCRLLADAPAHADYVYDGAGHRIILPDNIKARSED